MTFTDDQIKALSAKLKERSVVDPNSGCVLWIAANNGHGYGTLTIGRNKRLYAHRVSYELNVGPIPEGLQIDHLCRNRACINPTHLEPVTNAENARRGNAGIQNSSRSRCIRGHAFAEHGYIDTQGKRQCRVCHSARGQAYYQRKRDAHV